MNTNKVLGYIFIVLAILFSFSILGGIPQFVETIVGLFTEKANGIESGRAIGAFIGWLVKIALTVALWVYGVRWTKRTRS
ncbi:MAG: hypothetical protein IT262_00885 [Saprospiraceae bacterium]|nr:hypothetical protein [Saprospiraceae bacterium]